eukprot:200066-Amphidinium_carterae.1
MASSSGQTVECTRRDHHWSTAMLSEACSQLQHGQRCHGSSSECLCSMSAEALGPKSPTNAPSSPIRSRLLIPGTQGTQSKYFRSAAGTYILDKQAVVIDFGSRTTKVGFASEHRPQRILLTPQLYQRKTQGGDATSSISQAEWTVILDRL